MKKSILFVAVIMMLASSLSAQNVTFKMKRPPINQLKAADLWSATIINGGEPFTAYLYGSMTNNENGELIATGQTMTFEVKKGTTNFKISDLPRIPDVNYLSKDPKYKTSFINTGGAPQGDYKICCELRKTDNSVAGEDCFDQKIIGGDAPQLISPRNEEELKIDNPVFTWMHMKGPGSSQTYTLKIVEIKGDESPENAMLKNKAFFEKEGISQQLFQYPSSASKFEAGKKYAWQVSVGDLKSEVSIFDRWGNLLTTSTITLTSPAIGIKIESDSVTFSWKISNPSDSAFGSSLRIVELKGDESPENAIAKNKAFFEKEGIREQFFKYDGPTFETGKKYAWKISVGETSSLVAKFIMANKKPDKKTNCEANCLTNSVILNTGYNRSNNTVDSLGISDELWVLTGTPNTNISVPRIPTVISPNNAWVTQPNSAWISPYPTNSWTTNNPAPDPFYMYEACFCLCENSTITLNMTIAADDAFQFFLDDSLVAGVASLAYGHTTAVNHSATLNAGTHCLRIGVRNLGGVAMGLNVTGSVTGLNLLSQACCNNKSKLTGMKFNDLNCNGVKDANEPGLPGWTIQLSNGQSKVTDAGGFYTFTDLDAGNYVITEVNQAGWTQTMPSAGSYNVNLASQQVVSNLDFGNCEMPFNPCDSLYAVAVSNAGPVPGDCCWSLNLTQPANTGNINSVQFLSLSPNSFVTGSSHLGNASGWFTSVNNGQEFTVRKMGTGSIPGGQQNGFFNFCLNKLSSPQNVVVNWRHDSTIVCSDTVTLNCEIPCVTFTKDTVQCNGSNYDLKYSFTNNAAYAINKIEVSSVTPSNVTVTPSPFMLTTPVNSGATTNLPAFTLTGAVPGTTVCVKFKFTSPDGCCWCYDSLCVLIPSCLCNEVGATLSPAAGDPLNCCYSINLQNNYSANYFNQVMIKTLETGTIFSTWSTNTANNYYSSNVYPDDVVYLWHDPVNYPNSYIPTGNSANVLNFCLNGYTAATQHVVVYWMRNDSIKCSDTLTMNCTPLPPPTPCTQVINDTLTCLPNGNYQYTFHVRNNSSHTTTGFQINPVSPAGLTFTPSPANFSNVTIAPGMISPQQSIIISGVAPGSQFCFNISLYEHILIAGQQYYDWCCNSSEICKTAPSCTPPNECKYEVMIDSVKCKQNPAGQWYYNVSARINNMSGVISTLNSVLADNGSMTCAPLTLAVGMNNVNCAYTPSGSVTNPVCFTYRIFKHGSQDTCKYKICRDLPICSQPSGCNCGQWLEIWGDTPGHAKITTTDTAYFVDCFDNKNIGTLSAGNQIKFEASYQCNPYTCAAVYDWVLKNTTTSQAILSGTNASMPLTFTPPAGVAANYQLVVTPRCGSNKCDPCGFYFKTKIKSECDCGDWKSKEIQVNINDKKEHPVICGDDLTITSGSLLKLKFPEFTCKPKDCGATYNWELRRVEHSDLISSGDDNSFKNEFNETGLFILSYKAYCGGKLCGECIIKIKVAKKEGSK